MSIHDKGYCVDGEHPPLSQDDTHSQIFSSPNLPQVSSYNGSYKNSPYTVHPSLEFDGWTALDEERDYVPSEYDVPSNNQSPLLDFMNNPHISVTPPAMDGGYRHPPHSHPQRPSSPPVQGFESLRFDSPHWNTTLLPADKPSSPSTDTALTSLQRTRSDSGKVFGHQRSISDGWIPYLPSTNSDFIARTAADNLSTVEQQFLHPTEMVPDIHRGHHRSGSRDRGIGGMGLHSAPGSSHPSPYPSPSASPLFGYSDLSHDVSPGGVGELMRQLNAGDDLSDMGPSSSGKTARGISSTISVPVVNKHNVRQRKGDANFVCPVPGCGSTFTRHFNLKGA